MTSWQQQLREAITDPSELLALLDIDSDSAASMCDACSSFPMLVPHAYAMRMRKGDIADPLLAQVLSLSVENRVVAGFSVDPLLEQQNSSIPGLLHKYHGRVLITLTGKCAMNCRFCFRRHFNYPRDLFGTENLSRIFDYINNDATLKEVILSGGDPLLLSDEKLAQFIKQLNSIEHIELLRIHTRAPVVLPSRVTSGLLNVLCSAKQKIVVVIHCNHANELNNDTADALCLLHDANIVLLNQSVLLKGVNDSAKNLASLSWALFSANVLPYYLHLLDKVNGAAHFYVSAARAKRIIKDVAALLPGYLVPKLVREDPGASSKTGL